MPIYYPILNTLVTMVSIPAEIIKDYRKAGGSAHQKRRLFNGSYSVQKIIGIEQSEL